jgi:hypothetical protein
MRYSTLSVAAALIAAVSAPTLLAAQAPPGTDIYLVAMSHNGTALSFGAVTNVTDRAGYDNQPSFLPDGSAVLYTSNRGDQTDIYRYDIGTRTTSAVTQTNPESEYSPSITPRGNTFTVIRVEADSTQRLWQFDLDGSNPAVVLADIFPVGYQAWGNAFTLGIFVLGSPATFQLADIRTGVGEIFAYNVGRSIHKIPNRHKISFTHRVPDYWIKEIDIDSRAVRPLVRLMDSEFYAWTPDGSVFTGSGSKLYRWRYIGGSDWEEVADFEPAGIEGISRLAVSTQGDWIAIVGTRQ